MYGSAIPVHADRCQCKDSYSIALRGLESSQVFRMADGVDSRHTRAKGTAIARHVMTSDACRIYPGIHYCPLAWQQMRSRRCPCIRECA